MSTSHIQQQVVALASCKSLDKFSWTCIMMFICTDRRVQDVYYSHCCWCCWWWSTVASLGLVSPGAATDGVTLFFLPKKLTTFFSHRLWRDDLLAVSLPPQVTPSRGWHPTKIIFVAEFRKKTLNSATKKINFSRVSPPGGCHLRRPPPNDATAADDEYKSWINKWMSFFFTHHADSVWYMV